MSEYRDGYKAAVKHLRQIIPMIREEFAPLVQRPIPSLKDVTVRVDGDALDRVFFLLDDLSDRENIEKIATIFQYKSFKEEQHV